MKAAFLHPEDGTFEIAGCPRPKPGPGEVLVKVAYCGICGSDISLVEKGLIAEKCIIGHEVSGYISEVADDLTGWEVGDPVSVLPFDYCHSCGPCRSGHDQLCTERVQGSYGLGRAPGGFAQYQLVKSSMLFPVPEGLDMKTAALNEPWAVAWHGIRRLRANPGTIALVIGSGPIGILSMFALRAAGVAQVFVSEPNRFRADRALQAGAKEVFHPADTSPGYAVRERTGREPDYVIDCAGTQHSLQEAAAAAGPLGQVVVLGVYMGEVSLVPLICFGKEIRIHFSMGYSSGDFGDALDKLARGAVDPEVLISSVTPLSGIGEAFNRLKQADEMKVLIDCQAV